MSADAACPPCQFTRVITVLGGERSSSRCQSCSLHRCHVWGEEMLPDGLQNPAPHNGRPRLGRSGSHWPKNVVTEQESDKISSSVGQEKSPLRPRSTGRAERPGPACVLENIKWERGAPGRRPLNDPSIGKQSCEICQLKTDSLCGVHAGNPSS